MARENPRWEYSDGVTRVITSPDARDTIYFKDESPPVEADLVIGTDGIKSMAKWAIC